MQPTGITPPNRTAHVKASRTPAAEWRCRVLDGRRPRSLKGGNRGPSSLGGAARYGESGVGRCVDVCAEERVWTAWGAGACRWARRGGGAGGCAHGGDARVAVRRSGISASVPVADRRSATHARSFRV